MVLSATATTTASTTAGTMYSKLFLIGLQLLVHHVQLVTAKYSSVTLTSRGGDLSVVVFLPAGIHPSETPYYASTRFEHGSMIGTITRTTRDAVTGATYSHVLYGTDRWRVPHDPYWPESGVGLASEFGVGDDGALCNYRCGWYEVNDVTNGVLGYQEARNGESFLKIGVGELIKGSCSTCDSTDEFKFNSPYRFAKPPVWTMQTSDTHDSIILEHEAVLEPTGYRIRKDITVVDNNTLLIKTTLTNVGRIPFATAWYSHHFFTCDGDSVGPGYGADMSLAGTGGRYDEPGTWFWSKPLETYAEVKPMADTVQVNMKRHVERDTRIKAEFERDESSNGAFTIRACGTSIEEQIPEVGVPNGVSMYAFNLYIEADTFSPEPQVLIKLWPGQTTSWTQRLVFRDDDTAWDDSSSTNSDSSSLLANLTSGTILVEHPAATVSLVFVLVVSVVVSVAQWVRSPKRQHYTPILDQ
jgi:hypothetical protein